MRLSSVSFLIIVLLLASLALAGVFPSPLTIGLAATATSALVLWQAYAILKDDTGPTPLDERTRYKGYLRK